MRLVIIVNPVDAYANLIGIPEWKGIVAAEAMVLHFFFEVILDSQVVQENPVGSIRICRDPCLILLFK